MEWHSVNDGALGEWFGRDDNIVCPLARSVVKGGRMEISFPRRSTRGTLARLATRSTKGLAAKSSLKTRRAPWENTRESGAPAK